MNNVSYKNNINGKGGMGYYVNVKVNCSRFGLANEYNNSVKDKKTLDKE